MLTIESQGLARYYGTLRAVERLDLAVLAGFSALCSGLACCILARRVA